MKTILVLGGSGYIGSHTVYELIDNGYDVVVADNLETGFRKAVHPKARFYQGDIRNKEFCDHVFSSEKIDAVIHFAANSQVGESMVNPLKYYDNNLGGTRTMLQSMIEHGVKYIVFSSTAATYGEPERVPILETDPTHPTNCYGDTKLAMERMFYWASVAHGIHFVALRYFNACGAHMSGKIGEAHNPETHLIPIVLQVPNGQRDHVSIFGDDYPTRDGTCVRDYIHVCDLADAHIRDLEYLERGGESDVFNLGNGVGFSNLEVVEAARDVTGHPIPGEIKARRAGDPATLVASSEKARRVLHAQNEVNAPRRLLEKLQRRVLRLFVHGVGPLDDIYLFGGLVGQNVSVRAHIADLAYEDLLFPDTLVVSELGHQRQIRMNPGFYLAAVPAHTAGPVPRAAAQHLRRQAIGFFKPRLLRCRGHYIGV